MSPDTDSPALIEFVFVSTFAQGLEVGSITRLARQTWRHNTAAGLTGEMVIDGAEVRQVVEGCVETVLPLASRILSDPRHDGIRVLAFGPIPGRRHADWRVDGLPALEAAPPAERATNPTVVPLAIAARSVAPRSVQAAGGAA